MQSIQELLHLHLLLIDELARVETLIEMQAPHIGQHAINNNITLRQAIIDTRKYLNFKAGQTPEP